MIFQTSKSMRQRVRKGLLLVWILLFPVTIFYFSPYLPFIALSQSIISGSLLVFVVLFLTAVFAGRLFCGWLCPAGSIQAFAEEVNSKPLPSHKIRLIKYFLIWLPWFAGLIALAIHAPKPFAIEPGYHTQFGISITHVNDYVIYLIVLTIFTGLAFIFGKRAACHTICWMSPFMVFGQFIGKILRMPQVHIVAKSDTCINCGICNTSCSMSLPVSSLVKTGRIVHHDCILCLQCVDTCPKKTLMLKFKPVSAISKLQKALGLILIPLLFVLSITPCKAEQRLVPPTVTEDTSLPRVAVTVGGKTRYIHYNTFGNPEKPAFFVMPGSLSDIQAYLPFKDFADNFYIVLWDQRGQGLSERVDRNELTFDMMLEEISEMKKIFSPNKPIILLGHSWSAFFAALYAGRYPQAVDRLILLEPFGFSSDIMLKANAGVVNLMTPGYLNMAWFSNFAPLTNHEYLDFRIRGMLTSAVRPFFKDPNNLPAWPVRRVGGLALLTWENALIKKGTWDFNFSNIIANITAHTLLVGSEYSYIGFSFQLKWNAPLFISTKTITTVKLLDSGHRMITENWNDLSQTIKSFLEHTL